MRHRLEARVPSRSPLGPARPRFLLGSVLSTTIQVGLFASVSSAAMQSTG